MIHNSFFQAICRVGIFMICAQAIVHFRANESYEKYLKLLMSIMVLMQLFLPIGNFFFGRGGMKAAELMEQFEKELADSMGEMEKSALEADRLLEKMTLEEVRRRAQEAADAAAQETGNSDAAGTAGSSGAAGASGMAGTAGSSGVAGSSGAVGAAGSDNTKEREKILIELDGINPIKIGQEE